MGDAQVTIQFYGSKVVKLVYNYNFTRGFLLGIRIVGWVYTPTNVTFGDLPTAKLPHPNLPHPNLPPPSTTGITHLASLHPRAPAVCGTVQWTGNRQSQSAEIAGFSAGTAHAMGQMTGLRL